MLRSLLSVVYTFPFLFYVTLSAVSVIYSFPFYISRSYGLVPRSLPFWRLYSPLPLYVTPSSVSVIYSLPFYMYFLLLSFVSLSVILTFVLPTILAFILSLSHM